MRPVPWCACCGLPEHEMPAPEGALEGFWCMENARWVWIEYLDDDAIDREIIALRLPGAELNEEQVAEALGLRPTTIRKMVERGQLPPTRRVPVEGHGNDSLLWSAQAVAAEMQRRGRLPCGSETAYKAHLRHREPTDEACRRAHNEYQRAYERRHEAVSA